MLRYLLIVVFLPAFVCSRAQNISDSARLTTTTTTLVNNQLSPELVKIEYAGGAGIGSLKDANGKLINKFNQTIFTVSVFPAKIISTQKTQLFLGVGYISQQFSGFKDEKYIGLFSDPLRSVYLGTALGVKMGKQFFWVNYLQTALNGVKPFQDGGKTFNVIATSKIDYKLNRNLNLAFGFTYFSNLGSPLLLPAVTVVYSTEHFVLNLDFPVKTEVEGIMARGKIRPVIGLSYHGGNYLLKDEKSYLYNFGALGYFGTRVKVLDFLYLYAAYQVGVYDKYKTGSRGHLVDVGTYSGQQQFVLSLNVQFENFIPLMRK